MKKNCFLLSVAITVIALVALVSACGSTPAGVAPSQEIDGQYVRIDHAGAALGSPVPEWVQFAVTSDKEALMAIPRFSGKVPFIEWGSGQNLDLTRSWVNNFGAQSLISRTISTYIEVEFAGSLQGSKDNEASRNYLKELAASVSSAQFSGFMREMDYWIKVRNTVTQAEEYRYFVVYSMSQDDLNYQIAQAMGRVAAETQEQQELKDELEDAIQRVRFNSIQQATN